MIMSKDKRLWSVYKHTSPSGKVYIGVAKDIKHRWRNNGSGYKGSTRIWYAIQKYGWNNFDHEIVAENLTRQDACDMEIALIKKYKSTDPSCGYNLTDGGQHGTLSRESIDKLRASLMGHPVSDEVRAKLSKSHKIPLICIETHEVFGSAREIAHKMGLCYSSVLKAANGRQDTCGGFHFAKLSDYEKGQAKRFSPSPVSYTKVRCITTGEKFDNICDASRKTGLSRRAISYACNGTHKTCGKMQWEFINDQKTKDTPFVQNDNKNKE